MREIKWITVYKALALPDSDDQTRQHIYHNFYNVCWISVPTEEQQKRYQVTLTFFHVTLVCITIQKDCIITS